MEDGLVVMVGIFYYFCVEGVEEEELFRYFLGFFG